MKFKRELIMFDDYKPFPEMVRKALDQYSVIHVVRNKYTNQDSNQLYTYLVDSIGMPVPLEEDEAGNKTGQRWLNIQYDPDKNNSNIHQSFHTDGAYESKPPEVLLFYCLEQPKYGGATTFVDGSDLVKLLDAFDPNLRRRLEETEVYFTKGDDGKLAFILSYDAVGPVLNWNKFRASSNLDLVEEFHHFLEEYVFAAGLFLPVRLHPGEAVFFRDNRVLHGRQSFIGKKHLVKGGLNFK